MTICITAPGCFNVISGPDPEVGRGYALEDATSGTNAQNKAFHALITEYFRSGMHSYPAKSFDEFRDMIKRSLGAGFEKYVYAELVNRKPAIREARTFEEIPEAIRHDHDLKQLVRGRLKSWSDYTKKQRCDTLDKLIAEMIQSGVNSKRFQEIMDGMEAKS